MGADAGHDWYLAQVEKIELQHPDKRVVLVTMPCELPESLWNVEASLMRGYIPITDQRVPGLRQGVFGNFRIEQGPFVVRFNDGTAT